MLVFSFLLLFLLFAVLLGYSWYQLHKEVHVHATASLATPQNSGLSYKDFTVTASDNLKIAGWYIPVAAPKAFVILLHGKLNKDGGRALMLAHAKYLHAHGYATILFDMRGVGKSEGNTITLGVEEWKDVVAVYEYVAALPEAKGKKIGFLGISMGAAVGIIAAGKANIGSFYIGSVPYKSYISLFSQQVRREKLFPNALFTFILACVALFELGPRYYFFNPIRWIQKVKAPVLLISARNDDMVNPKDSWELYTQANKPKEFWEADSNHDAHGSLKEEFEDHVLNFLRVYAEY